MANVMLNWSKLRLGLVLILRLALGVVFLVSGPSKLVYPDLFAANVLEYKLLGPTLSIVLATVLPPVEIVLGICLIARIAVSGAFFVATGLMIMFTFAQSWVLAHGGIVSCSCFSLDHKDVITGITIWRDVALFAMAATGTFLSVSLNRSQIDVPRALPSPEPTTA
jgi:uncharacterized membrane protein YphA (DoxX/SURF4 family)